MRFRTCSTVTALQIALLFAITWTVSARVQSERRRATHVPTLLIHGGAGDVSDESIPHKIAGIKLAARIGYETLRTTGNVLDAVQEAVRSLELNPYFNAAYGAVLTWEGNVEMDAAIMNGADLDAGCVSLVRDIYHPILLARAVMENTRHKYLAGEGVMAFAVDQGFEILPNGSLVTDEAIKALEDYKNSISNASDVTLGITYGSPGTVGAVAIDEYGNMAAATSTGGLTGKLPGRIGDSPILGAGTYADNARGAVSATGHGESFMRYNVAARILAHIEYSGWSAQQATQKVLDEMHQRFKHTGGVISIDTNGTLGIYFTTNRMTWAFQRGDELHYGIEKGENNVEIVGEPRIHASDKSIVQTQEDFDGLY